MLWYWKYDFAISFECCNSWLWEGFYLCFVYTPLLWYLFDLQRVMRPDIRNCFVTWLTCQTMFLTYSMSFTTNMALCWKHIFLDCHFHSRDLILVIALSLYHGFSVFEFENLVVWYWFSFCLLPIHNIHCLAYYAKSVVVVRIYLSCLSDNVGNLITGFRI